MSKIVVARNQQEAMRRLHPKPQYSRVISVTNVAVGGGGVVLANTPVVGSRVWLLNVKILLSAKTIDPTQATYFDIRAVEKATWTYADFRGGERILPLWSGKTLEPWWQFSDGRTDVEWDMMMFYEGQERRFAVAAQRIAADNMLFSVSFEISEG